MRKQTAEGGEILPTAISYLPTVIQFALDYASMKPAMIDGGAAVSLIPKNLCRRLPVAQPIRLADFAGRPREALGKYTASIDLGLGTMSPHTFVVDDANSDFIILGLDFLRAHKLCHVFDLKLLLQYNSGTCIRLASFESGEFSDEAFHKHFEDNPPSQGPTLPIQICDYSPIRRRISAGNDVEAAALELLEGFPSILSVPDYSSPPKHGHTLDIKLTSDFKPVALRARRCSVKHKQEVERKFVELEGKGALIRGASTNASPITVVQKKDGSPRICVDYTRLNAHTIPLSYPLPLIQSLPLKLSPEHKWFSVLDLKEAYHSLPMTPRASHLAAIVTHAGTFLPIRTPFGLTNAPSKFCELVADMISGLESFVFSYIDDFCVFSTSADEHLAHLEKLFDRFDRFGMFVNKDKCLLARHTVQFLGHELSNHGIRPLTDKVLAITAMKSPKTITEVRRFLGCINYYRIFLPHLAETVAPLTALLQGPRKRKNAPIHWTDEHQQAFVAAISSLANATTLNFEDPRAPLVLSTDASLTHVGGVLEQYVSSSHNTAATRPIAFFSGALPMAARARSTFYRELTGLFMALRHFKHRVRGRKLIVRTDHLALIHAVNNVSGEHSPDETRRIEYIKEYVPIMTHIAGEDNAAADLLSRPPATTTTDSVTEPATSSLTNTSNPTCALVTTRASAGRTDDVTRKPTAVPLTPEIIAHAQESANNYLAEAREFIKAKRLDVSITSRACPGHPDIQIWGVVSNNSLDFRPILPESLRAVAFHVLHDTIHQGMAKSTELISSHYFWPKMSADIEEWVRACPKCQSCKIQRHNRQRLCNYPTVTERFHTLHMDLVGPLPRSNRFTYILTIRDRQTGFTLAVPLTRKSSPSVIMAFKQHFISIFGIPHAVVTDNGGEFCSDAFTTTCHQLGIQHKKTTPYHPQSNGMIERIHRTLKTALRALDDPNSWAEHLPFVILTLNNLTIDNNPFTPFQHTFGMGAKIPGTFLYEEHRLEPQELTPGVSHVYAFLENMSFHQRDSRPLADNQPYVDRRLASCTKVWVRTDAVRSPLAALYSGPFMVLKREEKYFVVADGSGMSKVSIDRLKAAYELPPITSGEQHNRTPTPTPPESESESESPSESSSSDDEGAQTLNLRRFAATPL